MKIARRLFAIILAAALSGIVAGAQTALTNARPVKPMQLQPLSKAPITMHMMDESKTIYQAIGKLAGLNVLFDPSYESKRVQVDFTNASLSDALRIVGELTGTFYKPFTPDTILVAANTAAKHHDLDDEEDETFYLKNASGAADANEMVAALRNMLSPESKVYLVISQDAIVVRTTPELLLRAQTLLNDLDLPKKAFRLTYTVTEMDGAKPVATHHVAMIAISGQNIKVKQGSRVPIATGAFNTASTDNKAAGVQTQYTYIDVGMNFDSTLTAMGDSAMLKADVERSSVAPEASGVGAQDPIINQTSVQGVFLLAVGKPARIGSLDMPGTSHRLDIDATLEPLH
jgi:type II secretory pathway component GspD/PulD (secretin)